MYHNLICNNQLNYEIFTNTNIAKLIELKKKTTLPKRHFIKQMYIVKMQLKLCSWCTNKINNITDTEHKNDHVPYKNELKCKVLFCHRILTQKKAPWNSQKHSKLLILYSNDPVNIYK